MHVCARGCTVICTYYIFHIFMDYCIKGLSRVRRASVADNRDYSYHFLLQSLLPPHSVYFTLIANKVQLIDVYM